MDHDCLYPYICEKCSTTTVADEHVTVFDDGIHTHGYTAYLCSNCGRIQCMDWIAEHETIA